MFNCRDSGDLIETYRKIDKSINRDSPLGEISQFSLFNQKNTCFAWCIVNLPNQANRDVSLIK